MSDPKTHELVAAGLRDDCDLYGLIPDNYICIDCGMDTWPGHKTRAEVEQSMRDAIRKMVAETDSFHPIGEAADKVVRGLSDEKH